MNPEDEKFVQSLNCWEDNYDVITDNIQKLSGLLSLQIQLLQNVQEEEEHERNVKHMTLEEQSISRMLNSFEQRFNVELSKLTEFNNKLDKVIELLEKLVPQPITINSPIAVKSEEGKVDINKHLHELADKISRRHSPQTMSDKEFTGRLTKILVDSEKAVKNNKESIGTEEFITKSIDVFKQQVDTNMFVYVGTMTDNVLTLNQSTTVLETHVTKPSTYFTDWFVKNTDPAIGCQWLDVHPSNHIIQILLKDTYFTNLLTTGYLTDDGRAVYYDQYL